MFQWPEHQLPKPRISITESRLSCLESNHSRDNRSLHLSANSFHHNSFHFIRWHYQHITGRCAHHLAQIISFNLSTHCTHMTIKCAHSYHNILLQSKSLRPCSTECAN